MEMRTALTIAGSDSGGGAGIQADLRTFQALGVYGASAITAITAQNTLGVRAVQALDPTLVTAQIDAVAEDFTLAATKIGMLANAGIVRAFAAAIDRHRLQPVVLDPVMIAKGGDALLSPDAVAALQTDLIPRATIVTPKAKTKVLVANFICQRLKVMRIRRGVIWPLASCVPSVPESRLRRAYVNVTLVDDTSPPSRPVTV